MNQKDDPILGGKGFPNSKLERFFFLSKSQRYKTKKKMFLMKPFSLMASKINKIK